MFITADYIIPLEKKTENKNEKKPGQRLWVSFVIISHRSETVMSSNIIILIMHIHCKKKKKKTVLKLKP